MRTGNDNEGERGEAEDDIKEFNPSYASRSASRQTGRSRASFASYTSRRTSSPQRSQYPTLGSRQPSSGLRASSQDPAQGSMSGRFSSLSGMFRPTSALRGSFSSRKSQVSMQDPSLYQPSEPRDSAEDLRQIIRQQEEETDGLENVRACCDGKHDVGSLSRSGRHRHSHKNNLTTHSRTSSHNHNQAEMEGANGH